MGNNILKVTITRKMKFPRFPSFWCWTIADIENLEVSESFFILIFGSIRNSKSKNQKNDLQQEKCNFKMRFEKKKIISEICKFLVWPYKQNRKLGNLGKFSFALNFDCIKCRNVEDFHWILKEWTSYLLIQRNKNTVKRGPYLCKNSML